MLIQLALVVLIPACALAQVSLKPYNETAALMFHLSDTNGDGILTVSEIDGNFKGYDLDGNGRISRFEYTNYVDTHSPQLHAFSHALYDIYDVDSDDMLDLHDYENFHRLMDSNDDGVVVQPEYVRYFTIILAMFESVHGGGRTP